MGTSRERLKIFLVLSLRLRETTSHSGPSQTEERPLPSIDLLMKDPQAKKLAMEAANKATKQALLEGKS